METETAEKMLSLHRWVKEKKQREFLGGNVSIIINSGSPCWKWFFFVSQNPLCSSFIPWFTVHLFCIRWCASIKQGRSHPLISWDIVSKPLFLAIRPLLVPIRVKGCGHLFRCLFFSAIFCLRWLHSNGPIPSAVRRWETKNQIAQGFLQILSMGLQFKIGWQSNRAFDY